MNKDNAKDYLPLVQALAEGKVIQVMGSGGWNELRNYDFTSPVEHYRIKPEPREIWVVIREDTGAVIQICNEEWHANKALQRGGKAIRYREVIE